MLSAYTSTVSIPAFAGSHWLFTLFRYKILSGDQPKVLIKLNDYNNEANKTVPGIPRKRQLSNCKAYRCMQMQVDSGVPADASQRLALQLETKAEGGYMPQELIVIHEVENYPKKCKKYFTFAGENNDIYSF